MATRPLLASFLAVGFTLAATAAHAEGPRLERCSRALMGSPWNITVANAPRPVVDKACEAAFAEVARLEHLMSEWRPGSELSGVNAAAGTGPGKVSKETLHVVRRALELARKSEGAFDPTWAAFMGLWSFKSPKPALPTQAAIEERRARVGWQRVKLDADQRTVHLTDVGMKLGLGGIAKGYAIDRAAAVLKEHGLTRFIVDGGGDLYVSGEKAPDQPWRLGVQHPRRQALLATVSVRDAALVTSGDYQRFFFKDGKRYHHILDLRTGQPASGSVAVTVTAPEAITADALATALFVLGPEKGLELAKSLPGVSAAILAPDGRVHAHGHLADALGKRWHQGIPPP